MRILSGEETAEFLEDIVYLDTQIANNGIDLTATKVYDSKESGEIDFGGSERKDGKLSEIEPELRDSEDDYGWWELEPGMYLLEYNESLKEGKMSFLQPLPRLTRNSATHPAKFVNKLELVPLAVSGNGIKIKENSRVSRILIFES